MEVSRQLRDERGGKATLIVVEDDDEESLQGDIKKVSSHTTVLEFSRLFESTQPVAIMSQRWGLTTQF